MDLDRLDNLMLATIDAIKSRRPHFWHPFRNTRLRDIISQLIDAHNHFEEVETLTDKAEWVEIFSLLVSDIAIFYETDDAEKAYIYDDISRKYKELARKYKELAKDLITPSPDWCI